MHATRNLKNYVINIEDVMVIRMIALLLRPERKFMVFRAISWSSETMIRPDSLLCGHFLAGLPPKFRVKIG